MSIMLDDVFSKQYFIWYFSLLPLVFPHTTMKLQEATALLITWFTTQIWNLSFISHFDQGFWLYAAYNVEFLGVNTFTPIWIAGIAFFLSNIIILVEFIR